MKNPLDETPVHITRRMQVETHLVDSIGDIGSCERQVLQGADDTAIEHSISGWRASGGICFRLGVDWRGRGHAIHHAGAIQNISGVGCLMEMKTMLITSNLDAEELVQMTQVLHCKCALHTIDDMMVKLQGRRHQDDVIDVKEEMRHIGAMLIDEQRRVRPCGANASVL
jgi:hypothetical protein